MKAYLATTGTLFGLLALLHVWNFAAQWNGLRLALYFTASAGAVAAALSVWAWVLWARSTRSPAALN